MVRRPSLLLALALFRAGLAGAEEVAAPPPPGAATPAPGAAPSPLLAPSPRLELALPLLASDLEQRSRRKIWAAFGVEVAGGLVGGVSVVLMLLPVLRPCATGDPTCGRLDTASNVVGAVSLGFLAAGVTLFALGQTERGFAKRLRALVAAPPASPGR